MTLDWNVVVGRLRTQHGEIARTKDLPLGNKTDPYDELVYILLTVMTRSQPRIDRAYERLADLVGESGWTGLLKADRDEVRTVLEPLGFVNRRSEQLVEVATRIDQDLGGTLDPLVGMDDDEALDYLMSLPGVGEKTAKCVLMYSLDRDVLPVDIHVLRVAKRLGLADAEASWAKASDQLERDVPDGLKFDVHVALVIHGREICKGPNPLCEGCVLEPDCPSSHVAPRLRSAYA